MEETMLTLREAQDRLGMRQRQTIRLAIWKGDLKAVQRNFTDRKGPPCWMVEAEELERWARSRAISRASREGEDAEPPLLQQLSPRVRDMVVPLGVACKLAELTRPALLKAINEGRLPAFEIKLGDQAHTRWQVRVGDLANWFLKRSKRPRVRLFNPALLAQLEELLANDGVQESGPTG